MTKKTYVVIIISHTIATDTTRVLYAGNSCRKAQATFLYEYAHLKEDLWDVKVDKYAWNHGTCDQRAELYHKDGSHIYTIELHVK